MARMMITGMQARRYAIYGRTAGVVLLVAAGALWALDIPGINRDVPKPAPPAQQPGEQPKPQAAAAAVDAEDVSAMATRIGLAASVQAKVEKVPEGPVAEPKAPTPDWAYLGCIREASRRLAMVSVDGHQKILAEGRKFGDTTLVAVNDDKITIEVGGESKTIDRGSRDGSSVAWVRNMSANAAPANAGMVTVGGTTAGTAPGQLPPEVRQRLQERGFQDPGQNNNNWRQNRGRGGQRGGGPGGGPGGMGGGGGGNMNAAPVVVPMDTVRPRAVKSDNAPGRAIN